MSFILNPGMAGHGGSDFPHTHRRGKAKAASTRESVIEAYLHEQVVAAGGWTDKFSSPGRKNVPDRLVTWPGAYGGRCRTRVIPAAIEFVELKATGKKANAAQLRDHRRRRAMGCRVDVIDSKALVDAYVAEHRP